MLYIVCVKDGIIDVNHDGHNESNYNNHVVYGLMLVCNKVLAIGMIFGLLSCLGLW